MGVSTTTNTVIASGDGTTTAFPFAFYFFRKADLYVYLYDTVAKTIALKVLGSDYTISGTPNAQGLYNNGGTVNMAAAPAATIKVVVSRFPIETQTFALLQNGIISSNALVQQLDYLTLLVQSLQDQINRCLRLPEGFALAFDAEIPSDQVDVDLMLGINSSGDGLALTAGTPGPTGPTGPAGPAGAAGYSIQALTGTGTLTVGSPVNQVHAPCDASGGNMIANLPAANLAAIGQVFEIKKIDSSANTVTITPNGTDKIMSMGPVISSVALDFQGESYSLVCRAVGIWDVI